MNGMGSPLAEYNPEFESFEGEQFEWSGEGEAEVFGEAEAMELAAELLEIRDEAELDHFLGNLLHRASRAVGQVLRSPIGHAVGGVLKGIARTALPIAGGALGTFVGGPLGTTIGSGLASMAGRALGLELEGLSQEDQEFEAAKQFVRLAGEATKNAVAAAPNVPPLSAAQAAVAAAAQRFAPGLLNGAMAPTQAQRPRQLGAAGRWVRRGRNIIIINC
jgi:hypothetical protein